MLQQWDVGKTTCLKANKANEERLKTNEANEQSLTESADANDSLEEDNPTSVNSGALQARLPNSLLL